MRDDRRLDPVPDAQAGEHRADVGLHRGRYGTWTARFYGIPAEMTFLAVTALACLAVVAARAVALRRRAVRAVRAPRRGDHNGQ